MKINYGAWFILLTIWTLLGLVTSARGQSQQNLDKAKNLIVVVRAANDDEHNNYTEGAGIIFRLQGNFVYIATANHLVRETERETMQEAQDIKVKFKFWPDEFITATLLDNWREHPLDLAVLRVNLNNCEIPDNELNGIPFNDINYVGNLETCLRIGDEVYPIGHPVGNYWYVPPTLPRINGAIQGSTISFAGTCQPGHSGGGLFNEDFNLIGMIKGVGTLGCEAVSFERIREILESANWGFEVNLDSVPCLTPTPTPTPTPTLVPACGTLCKGAIAAGVVALGGGIALAVSDGGDNDTTPSIQITSPVEGDQVDWITNIYGIAKGFEDGDYVTVLLQPYGYDWYPQSSIGKAAPDGSWVVLNCYFGLEGSGDIGKHFRFRVELRDGDGQVKAFDTVEQVTRR